MLMNILFMILGGVFGVFVMCAIVCSKEDEKEYLLDELANLMEVNEKHRQENGNLRLAIKRAEDVYFKELEKGKQVDDLAVKMFNKLEGNTK